jgi:hypothetical protein
MLKYLCNKFQSAWHPYRSWAYGDPCDLVYMICGMAFLIAAMLFVASAKVVALLIIAAGLLGVGLACHSRHSRSVAERIRIMARKKLLQPKYGNPLHLEDGDVIPQISITENADDSFTLSVQSISFRMKYLQDITDIITANLTGDLAPYGVTAVAPNGECWAVNYRIENLIYAREHQDVYKSPADIPKADGFLPIRDTFGINLSACKNSSMLFAGHTRSGKTSAIIASVLLPILKAGPDKYGSRVVVVDPKGAELSQASPHVLTPDNGNCRHIFEALVDFEQCRQERQQVINRMCRENGGSPAHWQEAGFRPSIMFLDEFVSLINLIPKKAPRDCPDYSRDNFKALLRRIITQGASAGCFIVISIAQASVGAGDLDTIVSEACGVKVLMRPTAEEASFIWRADQIVNLPSTRLGPGTAWISIDDGEHENPTFTRFPRMLFGEYATLGKMLDKYYAESTPTSTLRQ